MNQRIFFFVALSLTLAALAVSEIRKAEAPVGPGAILFFIADTQHELTRLPVKFTRISDEDEIRIGSHINVDSMLGGDAEDAVETQALQRYVSGIGAQLSRNAKRKLPWNFHYVPSASFVNAFALPGGRIFIGAGLMELMETEDELAAVLGHEIEHVDHYHCAERLQIELALRKVPLGDLFQLPVEIFEAGYTKDQELEADREGTALAMRTGYSPAGALRMFERFDELYKARSAPRPATPEEEISRVAEGTLEGYFRTHPLPAERIAQIRANFDVSRPTMPLQYRQVFLVTRGRRALASGKYDEALKLAQEALAIQPDYRAAFSVLSMAQFAQGDYDAAATAYRELMPKAPRQAERVRRFVITLAQDAFNNRKYDRTEALLTRLLKEQPNEPEALKLLARTQIATVDLAGARTTRATLVNLYPDAAAEFDGQVRQSAQSAYEAGHFDLAAQLARFSLEGGTPRVADQAAMLRLLGDSSFTIADFDSAGQAYRRLLDLQNNDRQFDLHLLWSYADALGAAKPNSSQLADFQALLPRAGTYGPAMATQARIELAGLMLLTGDESAATSIVTLSADSSHATIAPEFLGRLAWWYYRAGKADDGERVLAQALAQRPGDLVLQNNLGWIELERHNDEAALTNFRAAANASDEILPTWNSPRVGLAIARWRIQKANYAMGDFDVATRARPQWLNAQWVAAMYPADVQQAVSEIKAEDERRRLAWKQAHPQR